jgi:hypothetical protein
VEFAFLVSFAGCSNCSFEDDAFTPLQAMRQARSIGNTRCAGCYQPLRLVLPSQNATNRSFSPHVYGVENLRLGSIESRAGVSPVMVTGE